MNAHTVLAAAVIGVMALMFCTGLLLGLRQLAPFKRAARILPARLRTPLVARYDRRFAPKGHHREVTR